jgi:pyruvate, water dikinase
MSLVALADAGDANEYGGKAAQLGAAMRAGLPVPEGFALRHDFVAAVARGEGDARARLEAACAAMAGPLAVRSSAIGEDGAAASFAGQHATLLNAPDIGAAVAEVWRSAFADSAIAYRQRVGADTSVRMGVVVQRLVCADAAGVMFTRNPITRADELVIEAGWGLGEAVVQGMIVPDFYRLSRTGAVIECRPGHKPIAIRRKPGGDTIEAEVAPDLIEAPCLTDAQLAALADLAARCDAAFGAVPHDIEWAVEGSALYLLQRRPITALGQ